MWNPQKNLSLKSVRRIHAAGTAFTLIELLVVISIISLLVSIILPSITRAKAFAKDIVCAAHARGIGTAMFIYADEWNEWYPVASNVGIWGGLTTEGIPSWMEQLFPYVEAKQIYMCPEKPLDSEYSYFLGSRAGFLDTNKPYGDFCSVLRNRIKYVSAHVLSGCTSYSFKVTDCDKDDYTQDCTQSPVHNGTRQNILFADAHVQSCQGYEEGEMTYRYYEMGPWWKPGDPE